MVVGNKDNIINIVIHKDLINSYSINLDVELYNDFTQKIIPLASTITCYQYQYIVNIDLTGLSLGDYEFRLLDLSVIVYREKLKIV